MSGCLWCGVALTPPKRKFCCHAHAVKYNNLMKKERDHA